jgi:hypothetical protein
MAGKGPGSSPQSLTVLQRAARLYEGERWWLSDPHGEMRGIFLVDGGSDLRALREAVVTLLTKGHGFTVDEAAAVETRSQQLLRQGPAHRECQVTVEERTQLFGFLKKG